MSFFVSACADDFFKILRYQFADSHCCQYLGNRAVLVLGFLSSAFEIIEQGKVGVQTLLGKVQELESGLHVIRSFCNTNLFAIPDRQIKRSTKAPKQLCIE